MLARNFKQANLYFRKGVEADPKHEASQLGFAQTSWYLGQTDKAKETLLKLTEINPKNAMAWSYLAKLADESRSYSQALEYIQKALEYDKDYYYHWLDAGSYYLGLNKYKEAEDAWARAIKIEPDYFLAYAYRASLRDERKNTPTRSKITATLFAAIPNTITPTNRSPCLPGAKVIGKNRSTTF